MKLQDVLYDLLFETYKYLVAALTGVLFYFIYDAKTPKRPFWLTIVIGLATISASMIIGSAINEYKPMGINLRILVTLLIGLYLNRFLLNPSGSIDWMVKTTHKVVTVTQKVLNLLNNQDKHE